MKTPPRSARAKALVIFFLLFVTLYLPAATVRYVNINSTNPEPPFTDPATASTNIQDALDLAAAGDTVLVADGVYRTGGVKPMFSDHVRVKIGDEIKVQSLNGPIVTLIEGASVWNSGSSENVRCVSLGSNSVLSGFTLTNGQAIEQGGGVFSESAGLVTNCLIVGNVANTGAGAYGVRLRNCTLINNHAFDTGGGGAEADFFGCILSNNSAGFWGGGAYISKLSDCSLVANSSAKGGGASDSRLTNCLLIANANVGAYSSILERCVIGRNTNSHVFDGGGATSCELYNCLITNNISDYGKGGGAHSGVLSNCIVVGNTARRNDGGGVSAATVRNCLIASNSAVPVPLGFPAGNGGGVVGCTLHNCAVVGNHAGSFGGGAVWSTLYNCTITGNSSASAGGVAACTNFNCVIYHNISEPSSANYDAWSCTFAYCCTTPMPLAGAGNRDDDPRLASQTHLSADSPCIGMGSIARSSGVDIDGEVWLDPPCIGADQVVVGGSTGPLAPDIGIEFTNVPPNIQASFTAHIGGRLIGNRWNFGDGTTVTNQAFVSHSWAQPGLFEVQLAAFNDDNPDGVITSAWVSVTDGCFVNASNRNPRYPFATLLTAATNIQDAVDILPRGGAVFVADGLYRAGERFAGEPLENTVNRLVVSNGVTVKSINGPLATVIEGGWEGYRIRCAYVGTMRCSPALLWLADRPIEMEEGYSVSSVEP